MILVFCFTCLIGQNFGYYDLIFDLVELISYFLKEKLVFFEKRIIILKEVIVMRKAGPGRPRLGKNRSERVIAFLDGEEYNRFLSFVSAVRFLNEKRFSGYNEFLLWLIDTYRPLIEIDKVEKFLGFAQ